jgi:single-stranded DNA-binding protein
MFIGVATFGAEADACAKYLAKGRAVAVTGRLVYREWEDNGSGRSRHHIVGRVRRQARRTARRRHLIRRRGGRDLLTNDRRPRSTAGGGPLLNPNDPVLQEPT